MATVMTLLDNVSGSGTSGPAFEVLPGRRIAFAASGSGTLSFQGSFDGATWLSLPGMNVSANTPAAYSGEFDGVIAYVRAVSGTSSGVSAWALQSDFDSV